MSKYIIQLNISSVTYILNMKIEWSIPKKAVLVSGSSEGETELNAFDNALLKAGLGNANLVKVSSIIPKDTVWLEKVPKYPVGMIIPVVYSSIVSSIKSEKISAAVGVGVDDEGKGFICEYSGITEEYKAVEKVRSMVVNGFNIRGWKLKKIIYKSAVYEIVDKPACAFAAVAFFK